MPVPALAGLIAANPWIVPTAIGAGAAAIPALSQPGKYLINKIREGVQRVRDRAPMRKYNKALKKYEKDLARAKKRGLPLPEKPIAPAPAEVKEAEKPFSPIYFEGEDLAMYHGLPPEEKKFVDTVMSSQDPEAFLGQFPNLDLGPLEASAAQPFPSAQQLGMPEAQPGFIPELMQQTDFGPIADLARREFREKTIPGILNQLTGLGQTSGSSAFAGALGQAGEGLDAQLAALRAKYGLQRAQTLGGLGLKQQAIDLSRASTANQLGMQQQQQQFGQQQALAGLGLQQRGQNLAQQQANQNALMGLIGLSQGHALPNTSPTLSQLSTGVGLGLMGTGANMYNQQQQANQLNTMLKNLNILGGS